MIQANFKPNFTGKQLKRRARDQQRQVQEVKQMTLNAVLWQIIMEHAKPEDSEDGILTVPCDEIKGVPMNFSLDVTSEPDSATVQIVASTMKPKSSIVGLDGKVL